MTSKDDTDTLAILLGAVIVPAAIVALSVYHGWALSILWGWFVVPAFGMAPLNIPTAIGLSSIGAYISGTNCVSRQDGGTLWASILLGPLISLGFCWIVKQWM